MRIKILAAATALVATFGAPASGQRFHDGVANANLDHKVTLHLSPRWKECSIQLDAALTQKAWRQFTGEAGVVAYFRPLVDAEPMGKGRFEFALQQWKTGIDDEDAAWNDTFVHPDAEHWLFEGNGLQFPGLTARLGLSDRTDVGVYLTKNMAANYGFFGAQVQRNLVNDRESKWAASARESFNTLYGPEDVNFTVFGADLVASRRIGLLSNRVFVSPYAGVSATLTRSHEMSKLVNLSDESVTGGQATAGAVVRWSTVSVAMEYAVASVPSLSMKVGIAPRLR